MRARAAARAIACGMVLLAVPGCAAYNRYVCNYRAEHIGNYLGERYTGTSCSTYTTKGKHGSLHTTTDCRPQFEQVWQWTPESYRYYDYCMAEVAAGRSPPDPDTQPAPPPTGGKAGGTRAGPGRS